MQILAIRCLRASRKYGWHWVPEVHISFLEFLFCVLERSWVLKSQTATRLVKPGWACPTLPSLQAPLGFFNLAIRSNCLYVNLKSYNVCELWDRTHGLRIACARTHTHPLVIEKGEKSLAKMVAGETFLVAPYVTPFPSCVTQKAAELHFP